MISNAFRPSGSKHRNATSSSSLHLDVVASQAILEEFLEANQIFIDTFVAVALSSLKELFHHRDFQVRIYSLMFAEEFVRTHPLETRTCVNEISAEIRLVAITDSDPRVQRAAVDLGKQIDHAARKLPPSPIQFAHVTRTDDFLAEGDCHAPRIVTS